MQNTDTSNRLFQLAASFVNYTNRHLFLTGRAGTGKTTFLRHIVATTGKKAVVVAPTGVAAINAGGVTMHSFFQLPFGPFLPVRGHWDGQTDTGSSNKSSLFRNMRINTNKKKLLQELELLIIDEVSMVRADMLDAMDTILRHYRYNPRTPFGGVQVLFIGDLYQLPPVVPEAEWNLLQEHYKSAFFFDAHVMSEAPAVCIELDKIYRQNEAEFIHLLNCIRNNRVSREQLAWLNQRYLPEFKPKAGEKYITLTSHNYKAHSINEEKLRKLPGKLHSFKASIHGDFSDKAYPADEVLQLKEGAQIMFIKNDKGEVRRYYNGKIGTIKSIDAEDGITVTFPGEDVDIQLETEEWKNIRYSYNSEQNSIDEKEQGTFRQYPVRLAWAITIHKSQGLTFERAIVDAGQSFTSGQVYVALSRLTSMEGLVLHSSILHHSIQSDEEVKGFMEARGTEESLAPLLKAEQRAFIENKLTDAFRLDKLCQELKEFHETFEGRQVPDKAEVVSTFKKFHELTINHKEVADRFIRELGKIFPEAERDKYVYLHERVSKAAEYFLHRLKEDIYSPLEAHVQTTKKQKRVKGYLKDLHALQVQLLARKQLLQQAISLASGLKSGEDGASLLRQLDEDKQKLPQMLPPPPKVAKMVPGETQRISLEMFTSGKSVAEIAKERGYAVGTIEGHLVQFIKDGALSVFDLVPEEKFKVILPFVEESESMSATPIKAQLGDGYSFGEIRAVMQHWQLQKEKGVKLESNKTV